jgi:hypothetical protein
LVRRQGASGLGLEAQRKAIDDLVASRAADVIARFTEVESGKFADRPELGKALHLAKVTGATLLIAKLDRLSRNAAFLLTLRDSGVRFVAADMPEANDLTVGIMALVSSGTMRTFFAWTLRVTLSPVNSRPAFLKVPMVAMSGLLVCSEPAPIAASMAIARAGTIRRRSPRARSVSGGRWDRCFFSREE